MLTGFFIRVIRMFIVWALMGIGLMTLMIYFYYPNVDIHSISPEQIIEKAKPVVNSINERLQFDKLMDGAEKKVVELKNNLFGAGEIAKNDQIEEKIIEENPGIQMNKKAYLSNYKEREKKLFDRQIAIVADLTG